MPFDRAPIVDRNFVNLVRGWQGSPAGPRDLEAPVAAGSSLDGRTLIELLRSQMASRHLDLEARELKRKNQGFYTIGSSGHEGNVVLGRLVRKTDPAFLHYRSGALMVERARQLPGSTPLFDILLSLVAAREDPASGGRHKVFGSRALWVPPQTSTIASHLPKAVGAAFALERGARLGLDLPVPRDALVLCSFGDASANHSTSQGAFNGAAWTAYQRLPLPILFVCEDNGLGISVRTPRNWIRARFQDQVGIRYFRADGTDLPAVFEAARRAVAFVRTKRRPAFLHLELVRLLGHAGSDLELKYRDREEVERQEARDPLLRSARLVLERGLLTGADLLQEYESLRQRVRAAGEEAACRPHLASAREIMVPLLDAHPEAVLREACGRASKKQRAAVFGAAGELPEEARRPRHMAVQINRALRDLLARYPEMILFGEDVAGRKGGVYNVTAGLTAAAGLQRVFNTLLDETTILGLAQGAALLGFLPLPEIQYLAYYQNAQDQVRGEAATCKFFSKGAFTNGMVIRMASFGYQKGFGGHFHNDNSIAALRDLPGVVIAAPSRGDDAVRMLRTAVALARVEGRVVFFLEPIALYMTKDLFQEGDGLLESRYPPPGEALGVGRGALIEEDDPGLDFTIITYANGVYLSRRAARTLRIEHGLSGRVVDLRWLAPLDEQLILEEARRTGRVLVVDEGRRTGGPSEPIMALLLEQLGSAQVRVMRVCGADCFIPLGPAANQILLQEEQIVAAARKLCERRPGGREVGS